MSRIELFLITMVSIAPIIALLMVLPKIKFKKKNNKPAEPTKTYAEIKEEEQKQTVEEQPKQKEVAKTLATKEISTDDFESFIEHKKKNIIKPSRVELPRDFIDRTSPYVPRRRFHQEKKPANVVEEIQNLSPELKALIIAGVLDKRNYD